MALEQILNGDSGLSARNKINAGLAQTDTNTQNIGTLQDGLADNDEQTVEALNASAKALSLLANGKVFYFAHQDSGQADGSSWENAKGFTNDAYDAVTDNTACLFLGHKTKKYILSRTLNVTTDKPVFGGFVGIGMLREKSKEVLYANDWSNVIFSAYATVFEGSNFLGIENKGYISNIIIGNCSTNAGGAGGMNVYGTCEECTFSNCYSIDGGGAIAKTGSTMKDCEFIYCYTDNSSGGLLNMGYISGCYFIFCHSITIGGGFSNNNEGIAIECEVRFCYSDSGAGIFNNGNVHFCKISGCKASDSGGAIFNNGNGLSDYCEVNNCKAANIGGGIYCRVNSSAIECQIISCKSDVDSGGLYVENLNSAKNTVVGCYSPSNPASNELFVLSSYWNNTITQESHTV